MFLKRSNNTCFSFQKEDHVKFCEQSSVEYLTIYSNEKKTTTKLSIQSIILAISGYSITPTSFSWKGYKITIYCKFHVQISTIPIIYRVSQKNGNSVKNWKSSLLWISIVIPNFKCHTIIMSARVYIMKRVKDMPIMSPQDEQWRQTSLLCLYTAIFLFY